MLSTTKVYITQHAIDRYKERFGRNITEYELISILENAKQPGDSAYDKLRKRWRDHTGKYPHLPKDMFFLIHPKYNIGFLIAAERRAQWTVITVFQYRDRHTKNISKESIE